MASLPQNQRDQAKLLVGLVAVVLAVAYYLYPHASRAEQITADAARVEALETANVAARKEFEKGSIDELKRQAAEQRSALVAMRRLVPTSNEVPALLEEVSTAARMAGLDVGAVTPRPVITGSRFDTYRYEVTILGDYHDIGSFLANVGSLPRIVAPVEFKLASSSGGQRSARRSRRTAASSDRPALAATVTLQTYVERTSPADGATRVASAR